MATTKTTISVTCPGCDKVLRLSAKPAAGKKIKCPACEEIFVPKFDEEKAAITAKPGKAKTLANKSGVNGKKPRAEEEDDDDEEEERPAKKKKKKKAKAGGNMNVLLLAIGGGVLLLILAGVGVTAFVWPGFMLSKTTVANNKDGRKDKGNKGGGGEPFALTSFVHAEAHEAQGLDLKALRDAKHEKNLEFYFEFMDKKGGNAVIPTALLVAESEKVVVSKSAKAASQRPDFENPKGRPKDKGKGKGKGPPPQTIPVYTEVTAALMTADGIAKVKKLPKLGAEEKLGKYVIHRIDDKFWPRVLAFPTERIVIVTDMADADITTMLDNAATGRPDGKISKLISQIEQKHLWTVQYPDDFGRKIIRETDVQKLAESLPGHSQAMQYAQALKKLEIFHFTGEGAANGSLEANLQMEFEDSAGATDAKAAGDGFVPLGKNLLKVMDKNLQPLVKNLDSTTFSADGTKLTGKLTLTADALQGIRNFMRPDKGPKEDPKTKDPPTDDKKKKPLGEPDIRVSSHDFAADFKKDGKAAVEKFKGKTVQITGKLTNVRTEFAGLGMLLIEGNSDPLTFDDIPCGIAETYPGKLAVPGQIVTVKGRIEPGITSAQLLGVEIVKVEGPKLSFTADEFAAEFAKDPRAAAMKYDKKWVAVSGEIEKVELNEAKAAGVTLKTSGKGLCVIASFTGADSLQNMAFKAGQKIEVIGQIHDLFSVSEKEVKLLTSQLTAAPKSGGGQSDDGKKSQGGQSDFRVSSHDFVAEFTKDRKAAQEKYKDKIVEVTGLLKNLQTENDGTGAMISFLFIEGGPANNSETVTSTIDDPYPGKLAVPGQIVTVRGRLEPFSIGPKLAKVEIVKVEGPKVSPTPDELAAEFAKGYAAAAKKYDQKWVALSGEIEKVELNNDKLLGMMANVTLKTSGKGPRVTAEFVGLNERQNMAFKAGQKIELIGAILQIHTSDREVKVFARLTAAPK